MPKAHVRKEVIAETASKVIAALKAIRTLADKAVGTVEITEQEAKILWPA